MQRVLAKTDLKEKQVLVGGLALISTVLICYGEILFELAKQWTTNPNYSHGFVIPILSGYLIWEKKDTLRLSAVDPALLGLPVLTLGLLLLVFGKAASIFFAMSLSFLIVLLSLLLFVLGTDITKSCLFPLSYLLFMIPLPYGLYIRLTFRLKILTSIISTKILNLMGIPASREGNIIHFAQTSLQVVDACSGLRSFMSLLALAVIFAYFTQRSIWDRVFLVLLTIPIAIFSNSCRLTVTAILLDRFGPKATVGFFHTFSGMIMFAIAFSFLVFCGFILKRIRQ